MNPKNLDRRELFQAAGLATAVSLLPGRAAAGLTQGEPESLGTLPTYEWERPADGAARVPHWMHYPDRRPFGMAGLWESWHPAVGDPLFTFTILKAELPEATTSF